MLAIFLDIEETVIHSLDNPKETEWARKIFDFVEGKENIFLFSWALWTNEDVESFISTPTFQWICMNANQTIPTEKIISKDSLRNSFSNMFRSLDLNDFRDVCQSKEVAFELFVRFDERVKEFNEFVFIDDRVENKIVKIGNKEIFFVKAHREM